MSKYTKKQIREIALKIPEFQEIANKKDSQEICFVEGEYTDILKQHIEIGNQGDTLDIDGNIIGHHKGYMHYTIGKRRGFYVHGAHEAHFVKAIDSKENTITVCKKEKLAINEVHIDNLNMFIDDKEFKATVKLRYKSFPTSCTVLLSDDKKTAKISLDMPVFGVACGQLAVCYNKNMVIGSGVIVNIRYK
jgi:tRNA-specific 2-thiouridylase